VKIITSAADLAVGDVVQIATQLIGKQDGQPFWWRRFACVTDVLPHWFEALTLKLQVDEKDRRNYELRADSPNSQQVVYLLTEDEIPQGVAAMKMKQIHLGNIKLGED